MSIIIISADDRAAEGQIGGRTAEILGYGRLGPELLQEIAAKYGVEEGKLAEALEREPSLLRGMPPKKWYYYLSCIEAEVLERLAADKMVCWSLAAHLYVLGISHALRVRIISDIEQRAAALAEENGISLQRAQKILAKQQRQRVQWCQTAYGQDETDPALYDLVINLGQIDPDEAAATIAKAVGYRKFEPMTYSRKCLANLLLAAKVKTRLLETMSDIHVQSRDGRVVVTTKALKRDKQKKTLAIKELAGSVEGVDFVEVHINNDIFSEAAQSLR